MMKFDKKTVKAITDIFMNPEKALETFILGQKGTFHFKFRTTATGYAIYFREGDEQPQKTYPSNTTTLKEIMQTVLNQPNVTIHLETVKAEVDGLEWAAILLTQLTNT